MIIETLKFGLISIALTCVFATKSTAETAYVDLELILAVDVSNSVDRVESDWQHLGYTSAFMHPDVIGTIQNGYHGRIAVAFVEWAGEHHQYKSVDWMIIEDQKTAELFSQKLIESPRTKGPYTSISALIDFSRREFSSNNISGIKQVIDISGDGLNSAGRDVKLARNDAIAEGITINGLPVLSSRPNKDGGVPTIGLDQYYLNNVIGGMNAFVIEANMLENFSVALVKKLVREIKNSQPANVAAVKTNN